MYAHIDLIALSFGFFNLLRLVSYLPQIVLVARDKHGATAISFSCWLIWIGANATTALYSWLRLNDAALASISAFNAACWRAGSVTRHVQARRAHQRAGATLLRGAHRTPLHVASGIRPTSAWQNS